ncbi:nucleotidyltransferase family protein [Ideonella sp. 4Y16]|uniref:Nucleotidyltransferase family protein n=1 Tax=Ideonella alba TaxID=2824118 RepID=A0A941BDB1_9BURK|nr:nucleotidyltransferase family protein [Ideonella alba]MBQ0930031.1 nucleotidyltransferase family protein [Ideonella alba]MBQ0946091.1 nucleotidyltransferase family protein [Ideonella alba]
MSPAAPPRALILAAGRGERMRPLTDTCPKPLLPVRGQPLIAHHLQALAQAGVREVVINTAWLEDQFPATLGDGSRWGLRIHYSMEGQAWGGALETAGGIATALPWLAPRGDEPFWVVSGDIWCPDFRFDAAQAEGFAASDDDAWLWVVPNPGFNTRGDFALAGERLTRDEPRPWTYANLALCRPRLVDGVAAGTRAALGPLLFASAARGRLGGRVLSGAWENVGTPAQLAALQALSDPAPG